MRTRYSEPIGARAMREMRLAHRDPVAQTGHDHDAASGADKGPGGGVMESQRWRNWKLNQLRMEITLLEAQLHQPRTDYARWNTMGDAELRTCFGCEREEDLQPFRTDQAQWTRRLEDIVVDGILGRKANPPPVHNNAVVVL